MPDWKFRLAEPADAEAFSVWASQNPQIDPKDLISGLKKTNPTVLTFAAEKDGVVVAFAPVFLSAVVAHLGFNPEARASEKLQALSVLKAGLEAFYVQYGIRSIETLSKPDYGVAKWAMKNNFELQHRNLFVLNLNKEMAGPESVVQHVQ